MENGIGTGYAHSGNLANIVLLGFEIKNMNIFSSELNNFRNITGTPILLQFWKRYIDDGRIIMDIDVDTIDHQHLNEFISHFIECLKDIYP